MEWSWRRGEWTTFRHLQLAGDVTWHTDGKAGSTPLHISSEAMKMSIHRQVAGLARQNVKYHGCGRYSGTNARPAPTAIADYYV